MFDDPKKELEQLQDKLLQDEDWFEKELDSAKRMIGQRPEKDLAVRPAAPEKKYKEEKAEPPVRNFANGYGLGDTQVWTRELNFEEEEPQPQPRDMVVRKLLILAGLETLGILAVIGYWMLVIF